MKAGWMFLWLGVACCLEVHASVRPVADYKFTHATALGQVQGPEQLKNRVSDAYVLTRQGEPRYMNVPENPADGRALHFDGRSSYLLQGGIDGLTDEFVMEVWCRAATQNDAQWHGVVAHGDGGLGYCIVQHDRTWGVLVGGVGFVPAGPVVQGQWVHLAAIVSHGENYILLNGQRVASFGKTKTVRSSFAVADCGHGKEFFHGDIARVRLSRIGQDGFDPKTDLLIDLSQVKARQVETKAAAAARIRRILKDVDIQEDLVIPRHAGDWLVHPAEIASRLSVTLADDSATLVLANGLVSRRFYLGENLACYSFRREDTGAEFLRSVKPEATIQVEGQRVSVGGLQFPGLASGRKGQSTAKFVANYFLEGWLDEMVNDQHAFQIASVQVSKPKAWLEWAPMSQQSSSGVWPPKGLHVSMRYDPPNALPALKSLSVTVHYEIYDGLPVIGKWLSFEGGDKDVTLERTLIEELAVSDEMADRVFVESEYNHFHATPVRWFVDPEFKTDSGPVFTERMSDYRLRYWSQNELDDASVRFDQHPEWQGEYRSRGLLQVQYPEGPAKTMRQGETWSTFRSWILLHDTMDEDRKGLGRRKLYRTLMPWTQENLVYMHVLSHDSKAIRQAVDQCADCGFDMIVLTFGSGFNMMSQDPDYIARIKSDFEYAHSKGIKTGAYILFCSSRSYGSGEHDASPPAYGRSLCLGSAFAEGYFQQLIDFMKEVGQDCIETDGPYHGYRCEKTTHPLHTGRDDSWRVNWEQQEKFYRLCMADGIYIITPDWYYASGGRKMPMGYKEANWTLPRAQQSLVARQNIYDGTWWRTPSMAYHALPLTPVYGGGADSTMEPLSDHLDAYDRVLAQYFGMGIMACYRGYRLYDTDETRAVVTGWVDFYRRHQAILDSDIIHVRRPDGRGLDCMMHANASVKEKGLAFIWNPTGDTVAQAFELPLYYTGIKDHAKITVNTGFSESGDVAVYPLGRDYRVKLSVSIPANGYVWVLIEE